MVYLMFIVLIVGFSLGIIQTLLALLGAIIEPLFYYVSVAVVCICEIFKECLPKWLQIVIIITIIAGIGMLIIKIIR